MAEHHSWYNGSVWHIVWPYQVHIGQWPIFYDPAIFASYLEEYLMEKRCTWDNGSVWLKDRPCKIYVCQRPIFHGPLILPYIIVRFKLFLYIKKWHRSGVFVPLQTLALVNSVATDRPTEQQDTETWSVQNVVLAICCLWNKTFFRFSHLLLGLKMVFFLHWYCLTKT